MEELHIITEFSYQYTYILKFLCAIHLFLWAPFFFHTNILPLPYGSLY